MTTEPTPYQDFDPRKRDITRQESHFGILADWIRHLLIGDTPLVPGIDISHWNDSVDFKKVREAGFLFAGIKASEGVSFIDSKFDTYWRSAIDNGMLVFPYHFFRSNVNGTLQAEHHLRVIEPLRNATNGHILPPASDIETLDGASIATRQSNLQAFHSRMRGEFGTISCYSSPYFWNTYVQLTLDCYGFVAHWTSASLPTWPTGWPTDKRKLWQKGVHPRHSWVPVVPGVIGEVDVDYFFGTPDDLLRFAGSPTVALDQMTRTMWAAHPQLW